MFGKNTFCPAFSFDLSKECSTLIHNLCFKSSIPRYLHYTSPSDPALIATSEPDQFPSAWKPQNVEDKISTKQSGYKGSVNAAGIKVDTSNKVVKQILDVNNNFVTNEIDLDWGTVCVGGPFRQSNNVPCRAVVSFQQCDITLKSGITLKLGFLFSILAFLRGTKESGWLETTYIDSTMRIGRGNKGKSRHTDMNFAQTQGNSHPFYPRRHGCGLLPAASCVGTMFVLTRNRADVKP